MAHIFLSYSHDDNKYVERLHNELEKRGFPVWRDTSGILPGDSWPDGIVNAIRECVAMVIIMTPNSAASKWVKKELTLADELNKEIIPLKLASLGDHDFGLYRNVHYDDVTTGRLPSENFYKKLEQLFAASKRPITTEEQIEQLKIEIKQLEKALDRSQRLTIQWEDIEADELEERIRKRLIDIAKQESLIYYSDLGKELGFRTDHSELLRLSRITGNISIREYSQGRPMLSALVVNRETNFPGQGFYKLARNLNPNYLSASDEKIFSDEAKALYNFWKN